MITHLKQVIGRWNYRKGPFNLLWCTTISTPSTFTIIDGDVDLAYWEVGQLLGGN